MLINSYQGTLSAGTLRVGDMVIALPSGRETRVKRLLAAGKALEQVVADDAVVVELEDELDISRGDMLADLATPPRLTQEIAADLCWLSETPWQPARKYWLKHTSRSVRCVVRELIHRVDVNSLGKIPHPSGMGMNDIVRVEIKLQQPILADSYAENRVTGSFILIDEATNDTVAAGVIAGCVG